MLFSILSSLHNSVMKTYSFDSAQIVTGLVFMRLFLGTAYHFHLLTYIYAEKTFTVQINSFMFLVELQENISTMYTVLAFNSIF